MMDAHDLAGAQRELAQLGEDARSELEDAQRRQLELLAAQGQAQAAGAGGAAVYVAPTIRADGLELVAGEGGGMTSGGGTAADVLWGTMMGSAMFLQFPPPAGDGYYLWADREALERGDDPWRQLELDGLDRALAGVG
jgi:hypothetical protein